MGTLFPKGSKGKKICEKPSDSEYIKREHVTNSEDSEAGHIVVLPVLNNLGMLWRTISQIRARYNISI